MAEFQKLQTPLTDGEKYYYPVTTYDQIIMPDGISRWDGTAGRGVDENTVSTERDGEENSTLPAPDDADTLGGIPADQYVRVGDQYLIPTGGNRGQVLSKRSNADADIVWSDLPETKQLTVCGKEADNNNDIVLNAFDVGAISLPEENSESGLAAGINADTLGGKPASTFATTDQAIPAGGAVGQILTKQSDNNHDTCWQDAPQTLPAGGEIGQILSKKSEIDHDVEWTTPISGIHLDLLWQNASPTSTFSAQQIDLNTEGYNIFMVVSINAGTPPHIYYSNFCFKDQQSITCFSDGQYDTIVHRVVTITDSSIDIGDCWNAKVEAQNNYAIPNKIYGLRGESNEIRS